MSDITKRLRFTCGHDSRSVDGCYYCEAAELIDALRAELAARRAQEPVATAVEGAAWGLWGEAGVCLIQRGTEDEQIAKKGGERLYRLSAAPTAQPALAAPVSAEDALLSDIESYLIAAASSSMSRNNSEALAAELLESVRAALAAKGRSNE
jgi:hypothetical protein